MSYIWFIDIAHVKDTVMISYLLGQIQKWINPKCIHRKLMINFLGYIRKWKMVSAVNAISKSNDSQKTNKQTEKEEGVPHRNSIF